MRDGVGCWATWSGCSAPRRPTRTGAADLELADPRTLDRIARAQAKVRAHMWQLIEGTAAGFPWLAIAGKVLAGWLVIDLDATLITAHSDKEGAAPTFKMGYGFPAGGVVFQYPRVPGHATASRERRVEHLRRPPHGAGRGAPADPLPDAVKALVRVDGAGASHELIKHLLSLSSRRRTVLFTCGWAITQSDEQAVGCCPLAPGRPRWTRTG